MNVLIISQDPRILQQESAVHKRMQFYASALEELHIVVMTQAGGSVIRSGNLFIYPASGFWRLIQLMRAYIVAHAICRKRQISVISTQAPDDAGIMTWWLARRAGRPWQLQIHTDIMSPWYRRASWKEYVRYRIARFLIPRASCVRVVSERIKKSIIESGIPLLNPPSSKEGGGRGGRITVLPIYTDLTKFLNVELNPVVKERFQDYSFKMIAAGRFVNKEKNFGMLIDVMYEFVKICPDALLVIVGEGPDRMKYESRIMNYGLEKHVILEPWREDLHIFYKSFDVFLCSSNYEGWGVAVLEAMAAGLPVLMTDVGLAGEIIKDRINGRIVPVNDTQALLSAMTDLYNKPHLKVDLSVHGKETVLNLQSKTKEEYLKHYRQSFSV